MSPTNETVGSQSSSSGGASDQGSSSGGSGDQAVKQTAPSGKSDQSKRKGKQLLESIENPPMPKQVGKEGGQDIAAIVKKYTKEQTSILKKDLLKDLKAGQESFADSMTSQFLELKKLLGNNVTPQIMQQEVINPPMVSLDNPDTQRPVRKIVLDQQEDEYASDEDDDENMEDESLVDGVESKKFKRRVQPTQEVLRLWAQARKATDDYHEEDWKKTPSNPDIKTYTAHPSAKSFKAQTVDAEAPALKYKEQKDNEKKAEAVQSMIGAAGHMAVEMLVSADEEVAKLTQTIFEFEDPQTEILDPRREASDILATIRDDVVVRYGKSMRSITKILGSAFNEMIKSRRRPYESGMTEWKNARQIVKKLAPSSEYLFGGKLAEVAKNLKDSVQLNPLSPAPRFGLGLGRGKSKGAPFKGYQGQGPSRGAAVAGYLRGTGSYRGYKGRPSKFGKKLAKDE